MHGSRHGEGIRIGKWMIGFDMGGGKNGRLIRGEDFDGQLLDQRQFVR